MANIGARVLRIHNLKEWINSLTEDSKVLARDPEEFELHLAAHEWSLAAPLDINSREDFSCLPSVTISPFEHQVDNAILFFNRLQPRGLIADDVGLGKTITAGLIARELLDRGKIETILVICPKGIISQWAEELRTKFGINAVGAAGSAFSGLEKHPFWVTSYQTALRNMPLIRRRQFDLLILDEAHAVRNLYGTPKPPKIAEALLQLMKDDSVRYCIMLTATPIQNRLWDIFSEFEILATPQPNPLGTPSEFSLRFIADKEARRLRLGTEQDFRRRVSMALVRRRRKDVELLFPERQVRDSRLTPLPEERDYFNKALEVILQFPALAQYTYARSLMSSPWALAASFEKKAEQIRSVDPRMSRRLEELAREGRAFTESAKTRAVVEFARAAAREGRAERMIVFTMRLETLRFIAQALERAGFGDQIAVLQGHQERANRRSIADFTADPPVKPILLSTDVGAVGLNLQAGNVIVNYDLPWNPMIIEQRIGRVQRLGQKAKYVIVHNLVLKGTIEDHVVLRLMEKLNLFNQAIGEMEELLELCGYDDEHRSLEQVIMELVRKVAEQKDISEDLERMEKSRQAAEAKMREMREATEKALGSIRPADGPRLMNLPRVVPRMDVPELIKRCLRRAGATMKETDDGRLFVRAPRGEVEFLFDPADAKKSFDHWVRLVTPGTKAFDQIVKQVRDGAAILVFDTQQEGLERVAGTLRERLRPWDMIVDQVEVVQSHPTSAFLAWFKVQATVGTDRYETVVEMPLCVPGDGVEEMLELSYLRHELQLRGYPIASLKDLKRIEVVANEDALRTAVERNEGIRTFCRFYEERFREDIVKLAQFAKEKGLEVQEVDPELLVRRAAEMDPAVKTALNSLELRFVPQVETFPFALCGFIYDVAIVKALVRNRQQNESYPIQFYAVPLTGKITSELPVSRMSAAVGEGWTCPGGHIVPASAFQRCSVAGCTIGACDECLRGSRLPFPLKACTHCDMLVCERHSGRCSECGEIFRHDHLSVSASYGPLCAECSTVLPGGERVPSREVKTSAVSGRPGRAGDMRKSALSDRWAFPDEMVDCEVTGRQVLPDETRVCAITGKRVAKDLLEVSAVSGKVALRDRMKKSDVSGRYCLPGEEVLCDETGAVLLPDEGDWCTTSEKFVRRDLLVEDSVTGEKVLERLTRRSAMSGRPALPEHLRKSGYSGREGLPDEAAECGVCGATVLKDELLVCPETGRTATPDHFQTCEWTRQKVLPEGLAVCEGTGKRVRRSLLKVCPETGKRAVGELFERCEASGAEVLPEALAVSEVSGKRVRRSLLVSCQETGRLALPAELGTCSVTRRRVHPDILYLCPDTGLPLLREAAVVCEESGVAVHPSVIGVCAATGRRVRQHLLVRDDLTGNLILQRLSGTCDLTGRQTLAENLSTSSVSGKRVLKDQLKPCEESGRLVLPDELERCEATGKMVHPDLLFTCPETGIKLLKRLGERCEVSGELCAPAALDTCTVTGKRVRRSLLALDEVTGQNVQEKLLRRCERTGRRTVGVNLGRSQVSGALVLRDLLVPCEVSGALALPDELQSCSVSGKRVLPSVLKKCEVSGKSVLPEYLGRCEVTGKHVLPENLFYCNRAKKKALSSLFGRSELSGEAGLAELLQRCEATGRKGFPDELVTLSDGRRVAKDRLVVCPGCGLRVDLGATFRCASCEQIYCQDDSNGSICVFCSRLIQVREGQPLPPAGVEGLHRHLPWIRSGRYVLSNAFVLVEGRAPFWKPLQRPVLMVFERVGGSLEEALARMPLIQRPIKTETYLMADHNRGTVATRE